MKLALLKDGPFGGTECEGSAPLPEYVRAYRCSGCEDVHVEDEQMGDWPRRAARYSLAESGDDPAVYVYNGVGDGERGRCLTTRVKETEEVFA